MVIDATSESASTMTGRPSEVSSQDSTFSETRAAAAEDDVHFFAYSGDATKVTSEALACAMPLIPEILTSPGPCKVPPSFSASSVVEKEIC
jgi:hypothetical protein